MSLSLTLFFIESPWRVPTPWLASERISMKTNSYGIFGQIIDLKPYTGATTIPAIQPKAIRADTEVWIYEDEGLRKTREDEAGVLTYVWPEDLRKLDWTQTEQSWNLAVKAFIDALPPEPDVAIVLYWH